MYSGSSAVRSLGAEVPSTMGLVLTCLTRAPLVGGANIVPLPDFLDSSKTAVDIEAKLSVLSQHQFDVFHQNFRKIRREIFKEMAF